MKKILFALCVLMIVPTLVLASGDMVSISELRQQAEAMGRWTKTYEAYGRTIEVDIPIYIPNEKELAVYDCSAYTDYIKNPNDEDKTNVYAYNENCEEEMDYAISKDFGKTWCKTGVCYLDKKIRNPQVAILDGQFILHGREAGNINSFVLYTSEDGINWDEGSRIVDYHPAVSF